MTIIRKTELPVNRIGKELLNNNNLKHLENSSYYPRIPSNYCDIFKALEIEDDFGKAAKIIKMIPPAKMLLFSMKDVFQLEINVDDDNYIDKMCEEYPEDVEILLFIQSSLVWQKANKSDAFDYDIFREKQILVYALSKTLQKYVEGFSFHEVFLISRFYNLGLLAVARCLPGIYADFTEKRSRVADTCIDEFISVIPEELDILMIEKWNIGSTIAPYLIHYKKPEALGKNREGIRLIKQARLINSVMEILYHSKHVNKVKMLKKEIAPFLKNKKYLERVITEWMHLARTIAKKFETELNMFTNIFFHNLNVADMEEKQLIIDDLRNEYFKLLSKYKNLAEENFILKKQNAESTYIDNVTKLFNHSYFYQFLQKEIHKSIRYEYPISLLFIDIDFFRVFNETYGYGAGNGLLRKVAELIGDNLRESDIFARYNNDDLVILLPHTGINNAVFVAKKIVKAVANTKFELDELDNKVGTTVSIGVSAIYPPFSFSEKDTIIIKAKEALQIAKKRGGNRVEAVKI